MKRNPTGQVIVSGGTRGLGRALSLALGERGQAVLSLYRERKDASLQLEDVFQKSGIDGLCLQHDIATPFSGRALEVLSARLEWAQKSADGLTLIHNAALAFEPERLHLVQAGEFESQWRVAVLGGLELIRAVLPTMVRMKKGTIVTVLTSAIHDVPKGFSAYVSGKFGLMGLTKAVAVEYGSQGIRAFSVSPGAMATDFSASWSPHFARVHQEIGTGSSPDSVAAKICALLGDSTLPARGEDYAA